MGSSGGEGGAREGSDVGEVTPYAGQVLAGDLTLVRPLATGGMGEVWEARRGDEARAVKFLGEGDDPVHRERLAREAKLAATVVHPHAVRLLAHDTTDDDVPFLVMELVRGESLGDRLERGPLAPEVALELLRQVGGALDAVHEAGIVHRDVKPDNVLLGARQGALHAMLVDFGIAKPLSGAGTLTRAGELVGTPVYMAPEQLLDERALDAQADLWGLALVAYEALVARRAFEGETLTSAAMRIILRQYDPVTSLREGLPAALDGFFERALHTSPGERFRSGAELADAFEAALDGTVTDGVLPRARTLRLPDRLYGREAELAVLHHAYEQAGSGTSRMVTVGGYSGTGKTSLVLELRRRAEGFGAMVAVGKFDVYDRGTPYRSIVEALRALLRRALAQGDDTVVDLRRRLQEAIGDTGHLLVELLEELGDVLGPQEEVAAMSPHDRRARVQVGIGRVVQALATPRRPLILFLDDLQWADLASLELIEALATVPDARHVLIVGAFRDNEVGPDHPLADVLERLRRTGRLDELMLGPLDEDAVFSLVSDLFPGMNGRIRLAAACHAKTRGNPFFLRRFLESLVDAGHLRFDVRLERWAGEPAAVEALRMPDDVADFVARQIDGFASAEQEALAVAACVAHRFDLRTLAHALRVDAGEALQRLRPAMSTELVTPDQDPDRPGDFVLGFAHDRVRQAARERLDTETASDVHRRVGWYLLQHLPAHELGRRLFEVVEHLNRGLVGQLRRSQRARLRLLNLDAARRAIRSAAFEVGDRYLQQARELREPDAWRDDYAQTLAITVEGARAAWLAGDHERMERLVGEAVAEGSSVLDRLAAQEVRIQARLSQQRFDEALELTLEALEALGLALSSSPTEAEVGEVLGATLASLEERSAAGVDRLPMCADGTVHALLRLQTGAMSSAYLAAPSLVPVLACNIVQTTLRRGVCLESPYGFAALGLVLNAVGQPGAAYETGRLARDMLERVGDRSIRPRTLHVLYAHVMLFVDPLRDCVEGSRQVARLGLDTGDLEYAAWGLHCEVCNGLYAGASLAALEELGARHEATLRHHQQLTALGVTRMFVRAVATLRCDEVLPSLSGPDYDEDERMATFRQLNFRGAAFVLALMAGWVRYLYGDITGAVARFDEGASFADGAVATYHVVWFHQLRALAVLAGADDPAVAAEAVRGHLDVLRSLAAVGPGNHAHRVSLVEGELARVRGAPDEALAHFASAARHAADHGFQHEEALAHELAARVLAAEGRPARDALQRACSAYRRWGAMAKAAQLDGPM